MTVNPLPEPPTPPNGDVSRALFVWVAPGPPDKDPLNTDAEQQALIDFCGAQKVSLLYLGVRQYITSGFDKTKQARIRSFLDVAHRSGIRVLALGGNPDWGVKQHWVGHNVLRAVAQFNAIGTSPSHQFDGFCFDVEYWSDEATYPPNKNLPGLCELVKNAKKVLGPGATVGAFAAFNLKDNTHHRPNVLYNGKQAQDGEHLMDACDFVVVGAYRNSANPANGHDGQIQLMQPWYDYAVRNQNKVAALLCGTETIVVSPPYITYAGMTKAAMEAQQTAVSKAFSQGSDLAFHGIAVHDYYGWKALP